MNIRFALGELARVAALDPLEAEALGAGDDEHRGAGRGGPAGRAVGRVAEQPAERPRASRP